ncbi:MAG TPA: diacylglycerol kinase [Caldisericia bacterium]|nr:diacylglycerol kinase [Caldisericia bacterium]HPF49515.1 diacylglycerol kinase [Caldisericia bacterium]HPI84191.1 diacylglycerol kinase [Caldisericia bacterium]HPQ93514.1 diacylglycerol kinase [Caldisericia bacterium]HRV75480.1 diacylglycerol kinase [Caldisericia bacterium]
MAKQSLIRSFKRAFIGIGVGLGEKNFIRHIASTVGAVFLAIYYGLSSLELAIIVLCCFAVLSAELLNTSVEKLANGHKNPRQALDVAASGVLFMAFGALAVGIILFWPHICTDPLPFVIVAVSIPLIWVLLERDGSSN